MKNPDFLKIAEGYGIKGKKVEHRNELVNGLKEMYASGEAFVLEVVVENEENVFPMVATGAGISEITLE